MTNAITVEEEFKKNKELKKEEFLTLKNWYLLQPHLPPTQDELLIFLYHSCWYKMEQTKITIDNYFSVKTHAPDLFSERDPFVVNMRNGSPVMFYSFMSRTTPKNHRVMLMKLLNTDPSVYVFSEVSKSFFMHFDIELLRNGTAYGDEIIFDMEGITLGHLARLNLMVAKKALYYIQEAMPIRLVHLHFINVVPFIDKIMALLRPFMNKEFMDKLKFHMDGMDSLYEYVPKNILTTDYGGSEKSIAELNDKSVGMIQEYRSWFVKEEKLRVDESKRPVKARSAGDIFGVDGSFKKLDFD